MTASRTTSTLRRTTLVFIAGVVALSQSACTPTEYAIAGAAGAAVVGGQAPTQEIQQVYYLGVFDPLEQIPPSVYRITVRGQGSFLTRTRFASGWIPAAFADSLTPSAAFNIDASESTAVGGGAQNDLLSLGRRMIMFGPEGFLESPVNHRLVIVMGADPSKFFGAIGSAVLQVAQVQHAVGDSRARHDLMDEYVRVQGQLDRLHHLREQLVETPR